MPNATVLVVDDEPLIRWSLINRLKEEGYRTLEAGTAGDAVAQHRNQVGRDTRSVGGAHVE